MLTRSGDDLFSIAVASAREAQALAQHLRDTGDWLEVIPGIDTVVVRFDAASLGAERVSAAIEEAVTSSPRALPESGELLEIPVVYGGDDGPDFDALCQATGLAPEELIALHSGGEYTVDMIGFTPGFAFVGGLDDRFRIPRRDEPRQRVEAGSIGIADGRTGLYALASPGGWNIIGRTSYKLFDPVAASPFALQAGMRVRFKAVNAHEFES